MSAKTCSRKTSRRTAYGLRLPHTETQSSAECSFSALQCVIFWTFRETLVGVPAFQAREGRRSMIPACAHDLWYPAENVQQMLTRYPPMFKLEE
jgi:hypothetical protein